MNDSILQQLRQSAAIADPVPDTVVRLARTAFAWAGDDTPVAEVVHDSSAQQIASTRSGDAARLIELTGGDVRVLLEVATTGAGRSVTGQLHPPQPATLQQRHPEGTTSEIPCDDLGRFELDDLQPGPFSLRVQLKDRLLTTEWVLL